jgi:3-deoxy-D-manno-octulosonic acid (KDO) 8-phosphate synthase
MEVHDNPDEAPSDGPNMIDISDLNGIVEKLKRIDEANVPTWSTDPWAQLQIDYDRFDG